MKYCVSTDVGTWMNLLTFEPDPDYSPDAGTGLFSPLQVAYKLKSLGVTIDSHLRFDRHVRDVARACNYHTLHYVTCAVC